MSYPVISMLIYAAIYWFFNWKNIGQRKVKSHDLQYSILGEGKEHGLTNFIDTKAKCSHLKNLILKVPRGRCLSEFRDWRYSQSCWYLRPSFVNCCPSNLLTGSTLPLSPLFCVNKYTVYKYTVCKGGYGVSVPQKINTCRIVPSQVNFLDDDILHRLLWL